MKKILVISLLFVLTGLGFTEESPQQFQGFNLSGYSEGGSKSWDVKGDTADIMGSEIKITNVVANAYGEQKVNVVAQNGTLDKASGNMHLEKDVVITSESGAQLTTDYLDWQKEKDLVTTEAPVTITDKNMTAIGTGMIAQPALKTAQMKEDVTVKVNTEPQKDNGKMLTITCDGPMEIDQAKQIAIFNTNVVAVQEGRTLKADRVELYFDPDNKKIKELICIGNVEINQGINTSYSERAVYKADSQTVTLTGRPKLVLDIQGENAIASFGDEESH